MRLNGRNLEPNLRGDDVKLLQDELRQLGFEIVDQEGFFGSTTFLAVKEYQQQHNLPATGIVDARTARAINAAVDARPRDGYVVKGRVVHADGSPVVRATVVALEKRVRDERTLGKDRTDGQGLFEILYPLPEQPLLSLLVRVSDASGNEIAVSEPICDVDPVEVVTLVAGGEVLRGPSEYRQLEETLRPALAAERLDPADLEAKDADFLACTFELSLERVAHFVASARLQRETDITQEALYGLLRQGLSAEITTLVAQSQGTLRNALLASIRDNIIDPQLEAAIPGILEALQNQIVRLALRDPEPDRPTFAALFDIAGVDSRHRQRIVEDYVKREGTVEEYWQQLRDDPDISNDELDALQDSLKLSTIALNHVGLVSHLTELRRTGAIGPQLRDLSRLRPDEWRDLLDAKVDGKKMGAPAFFGEDEEERIERYAAFLPRMVESLFPTAVLSHRLAEMDSSAFDFQPALAFLDNNPDFEFRSTLVQPYLDEHPDALAGIPEPEAIVATLKSMQRLFEVTPAFNKAQAVATLMAGGIGSAVAIRRMGPTQFIRQNQQALGLDEAQETYTRAARKADTALFVLSQSMVFNPTNPAVIAPHLAGQGIPDLEDLFGSLDLCQCEHCNSVYSPAAYLVDILHYLMNRPAVSGGTALEVLFDRRPDLGEIDLSCHNTNTVLPYVDLVLEILETAVTSGGTLPIVEEEDGDLSFPFQTLGDADALGANPEHLNEQAYQVVRNAVYPWLLPFDLWYAEARTYLEHLGVPFHELMSRLDFAQTPGSRAAAAAEALNLTAREREIITGSGGDPLHSLWGFDTQGDLNQFRSNRNAAQMMQRTGLTYEELTDLLEVDTVDPAGNLEVQFDGADCNLNSAIITNLNNNALDRIQRFVRLWSRGSWSIPELGAVLETLDVDNLDDGVLGQLATVTQLQRELKTPLPVVLIWLADVMPTTGSDDQPSLYDQVFLDPTVHKPELAIFALNQARTELADASALLSDHLPITYSALGISAADLTLLVEAELPDADLNLSNLTRLYQAVSLSKKLGLSVPEYISLRGLSGIDPFGAGAVEDTRQFVELAGRVRSTAFTVAQIDYLLRHKNTQATLVGPADEEVTALLVALRAGLHQIALGHTPPESGDAILQMTEGKLALVLPADMAGQVLAIANRTSTLTQQEQTALIEAHLSFLLDPQEVIAAWFEEGEDAEPGQRALVVLAPLLQYLRRLAGENLVVQTMASALGIDLLAAEQLLRSFVPVPDSDRPTLDIFLAEGFAPQVAAGEPPPDFEETTSADLFPEQYASYHRLAKVALVLTALKVPADGIEFLFTEGVASGWPDLNSLPLEPVEQVAADITALLNMADLFRLASSLFGGLLMLFDLLSTLDNADTEREDFVASVAFLSGWNLDDVVFLTGSPALDIAFPEGFRGGQFLLQLSSRFQLLRKLPVSAQAAHQWAANGLATQPVTADTARAIKQSARARYEDKAQWLAVAKPLRDALREQQRAAMVAYLVHAIRIQVPHFEVPQPQLSMGDHQLAVQELQLKLNMAGAVSPLKVDGIFGPKTRQAVTHFQEAHDLDVDGIVGPVTWAALNQINRPLKGPNELYAHFLIDVEMDPCMLTSRIVLANSSVQLFVQRCLLNLEPQVQFSPEDGKEWEWMKIYRVWEANRKVFLYPENWVYPELRDDKTPLFAELESGLLQGEINDLTIEREYLKYLNGLNQIAQLEIGGIYREWEKERDILHVFGRTHNTPHIYFYRQWVDRRTWTPWERVEVDIEGDHLVPVVWNRRLYLFWPMFMEKAEEVIVSEGDNPPPKRYDEIRMAWSEYRDGRWSSKHVSEAYLTTFSSTSQGNEPKSRSHYSFWPQFDDNNRLYILHYGSHLDSFKQFRFAVCDGSLEVTGESDYDKFSPIVVKVLAYAGGTGHYFNGLVGLKNEKQPLNVITSGTVVTSGFEYLNDYDETNVLEKAPARFRLVVPSTERHFRSQSTFAYYDEWRTFFIIPRGVYSGGFADPDFGLKLETTPVSIPLELPDSVTKSVASFVSGNTGGQVSEEAANPAAPAALPVTLLAPLTVQASTLAPMQWEARNFRFENHYHPYVCLLIEELNRYGIDGVLKPDPEKEQDAERKNLVKSLRRQKRDKGFFTTVYDPNDGVVDEPRPREVFDFEYGGAYSVYNYELFFHAPLMLAKRLSDNRRFAEAHRWFHFIFDPTYRPQDTLSEHWPERVWQIKPFFEQGVGQSIQRTMLLLKSSGLTDAEKKERKSLQDQIEAWRTDPFNPHLIARMRPEAYMKATVMAYLDNLIAWGDHLFRQDSMESINEATQIYILAAEILGERPLEIAAHEDAIPTIDGEEVKTFNDLRGRLDAFSNVLVELETWIEPDTTPGNSGGIGSLVAPANLTIAAAGNGNGSVLDDLPLAAPHIEPPDDDPPIVYLPLAVPIPAVLGPTLFFCIPKNDKLLGYWDTVEDRLFKIRHCMNIEGVFRQLPLFQPPIDPGLLVKAAAAGVDIDSALSDLNAPLPTYRFQVIQQKANELISDVKSLGAALLSAIEKRDAEELALLRSSHESRVLKSVRQVKEKSIEEARANLEALRETRKVTKFRFDYYDSRPRTTDKEVENLEKLEKAHESQLASQSLEIIRGVFAATPNFDIGIEGFSSTPTVKANWGGTNLASVLDAASRGASIAATVYNFKANKASIEGGYDRREDDWIFQADSASKELTQIDKQIAAVELRIAIAEKDLESHDAQIENARQVEEYLQDKYTHPELYSWMLSQVSGVYFQSYQLAYDLARQAERAFRYELGIAESSYVQFGYWDNLKKGLMSGEKLQADLRRLEVAYLEENRREYELTKHVSLALLNPLALLQLKEEGRCQIEIPEALFDLDYPGHYFRRIKSVTITIPAVTGPYTTLSCTLRLLHSSTRRQSTLLAGQYARDLDNDDPRFNDTFGAIQSIATSGGQNDSGLFELSFRDERYLPFEGAGAISRWQLEMPGHFRQFDYDSISDIILHISYTAREGGGALLDATNQHLLDGINALATGDNATGLNQAFSARHEFPTEFHRFLHPAVEAEQQTLAMNFAQSRFPYMFKGRGIVIDEVHLFVRLADDLGGVDTSGTELTLTHPGGEESIDLGSAASLGNLRQVSISGIDSSPGAWELVVAGVGSGLAAEINLLNPDAIEDVIFILHFRVLG